jgi:hypothetical protein
MNEVRSPIRWDKPFQRSIGFNLVGSGKVQTEDRESVVSAFVIQLQKVFGEVKRLTVSFVYDI